MSESRTPTLDRHALRVREAIARVIHDRDEERSRQWDSIMSQRHHPTAFEDRGAWEREELDALADQVVVALNTAGYRIGFRT